jgi:hypothetical protein
MAIIRCENVLLGKLLLWLLLLLYISPRMRTHVVVTVSSFFS